MRVRHGLALAAAALALLLGGCGFAPDREPTAPQGQLALMASPGNPTVCARVLEVGGDKYAWDWGDGTTAETTTPTACHTYAEFGQYLVRVQVFKLVQGGTGLPGPGQQPIWTLLVELHAFVDIRPQAELKGIAVVPVTPPPWYDPSRWPADHFPPGVPLKLIPILVQVTPDWPRPILGLWRLFRDGEFHYQTDGITAVLPGEQLLGPGCHDRRMKVPYEVLLELHLTDGSVHQARKTFYICTPQGCG